MPPVKSHWLSQGKQNIKTLFRKLSLLSHQLFSGWRAAPLKAATWTEQLEHVFFLSPNCFFIPVKSRYAIYENSENAYMENIQERKKQLVWFKLQIYLVQHSVPHSDYQNAFRNSRSRAWKPQHSLVVVPSNRDILLLNMEDPFSHHGL